MFKRLGNWLLSGFLAVGSFALGLIVLLFMVFVGYYIPFQILKWLFNF